MSRYWLSSRQSGSAADSPPARKDSSKTLSAVNAILEAVGFGEARVVCAEADTGNIGVNLFVSAEDLVSAVVR